MAHLNAIKPALRPFAHMAIADGMTVYAAEDPERTAQGEVIPQAFFHYSREIAGQTCYGTVSIDHFGFFSVSMPRPPSREFGSSVVVYSSEYMLAPLTVEVLRKAASRRNGHAWATKPIDRKWAQPQPNAAPWGIGTKYRKVI